MFKLFIFVSVFALLGCTYKNAEEVYPVNLDGCDTMNISYKGYIQPILAANCYSCHSYANSGLGSGFVLDNWLDVKAQAQNNNLVTDISIMDVSDVHHMPNGLPSLSPCDVLKISAWVHQGSNNN